MAIKNYSHKFCLAPMLGYTDRHFRYLFRLISKHAFLYSEMITTSALLHGKKFNLLEFNEIEHPVALQLAGNQPHELAVCAKLGEQYGYDEINLNIGCPSPRVQAGGFGVTLMNNSQRVEDCIKAMQDAVSIPVTMKMRLGLENKNRELLAQELIIRLHEIGCRTFIIHARFANLKNNSPKKNRTQMTLSYNLVYEFKRNHPDIEIIINGGISSLTEINDHLKYVDGVMVGQAAYHDSYNFINIDSLWDEHKNIIPSRWDLLHEYLNYVQVQLKKGSNLQILMRHSCGLFKGVYEAAKIRNNLLINYAPK